MGWRVWPKGIFFGMLLAFLFLALTGCAGKWYGEGTVVDKGYSGSYLMSCGKACFTSIPECYRLKVVEYNGDEHEGCVSSRVWENAMLGHHIAITPDYH